MTLTDVATSLRESHRPGERSYLLLDIDEIGNCCYTVQRIAGAKVYIGSSLKNPGDALFAANDGLANAEMRQEVEEQLARP